MKLKYIKNNIFEAVDLLSNDTEDLDMTNDEYQENDVIRKNLLHKMADKEVSKYIDVIFNNHGKDFSDYLHENDTSGIFGGFRLYTDPYICNYEASNYLEYYLFCWTDDNLIISESGQMYNFFKDILTQLLLNDKIIYEYVVDFNKNENYFSFKNRIGFYSLPSIDFYDFVVNFCKTNFFHFATQPDFLKNIVNILLDFLCAKNLISDSDKQEFIDTVDWKNSYIKFVFKIKKEINQKRFSDFYKLETVQHKTHMKFGGDEFRCNELEKTESIFENIISYNNGKHFDFSDFETPIHTGDGITIFLNAIAEIKHIVLGVKYYANIIGLCTGHSDTKINIVFCPKSFFSPNYEDKRNLMRRLQDIFDTKNINFYNSEEDYLKNRIESLIPSVLKEAIFIDLNDEFNDIEEIDDDNNTNQKILNEIVNKSINKYIKTIFDSNGNFTEDFKKFLSKNIDFYNFYSLKDGIPANSPKKYISSSIMFGFYEDMPWVSIKSLFTFVLKQIFFNNNKIIYNYDLDVLNNVIGTLENEENTNVFVELLTKMSINFFSWMRNITNNRFLYNVARCMLDYLVQKNRISSDERKEILKTVDWNSSKVIFHFKIPNNCNYKEIIDFNVYDYYFIFNKAFGFGNKILMNSCRSLIENKKIKYFDFSDIITRLNLHTPKIDFSGFGNYKNKVTIKSDTFIELVVYYTKIIGLITNTKTEDVCIDVYCPSEIFNCDFRYGILKDRHEKEKDTLQRAIKTIYDTYRCLNVKFYDAIES